MTDTEIEAIAARLGAVTESSFKDIILARSQLLKHAPQDIAALLAEVERLRASRPEWVKCRSEQQAAIRERDAALAQVKAQASSEGQVGNVHTTTLAVGD